MSQIYVHNGIFLLLLAMSHSKPGAICRVKEYLNYLVTMGCCFFFIIYKLTLVIPGRSTRVRLRTFGEYIFR